MPISLTVLLVSSNELELLAIPQTSQEAGATEGNNTLVNIRGVAMVYPLPQGSLGPYTKSRTVTGVPAVWFLGALSIYAGLSGVGRNQSLLGGDITSP